jgi:3-hydroxyisobutyrate dehydrogenase-like beta-hydroxyacid dehydrogenase
MELTFLGTGMMGRPMIENLLADGDRVTVWNRTAGKAHPLAEKGASVAASALVACAGARVVLSCLADDRSVRAVFEDPELLDALGDGAVHVSMTTISPGCARDLARLHAEHGVAYLAAPILGRPDFVAERKQAHLLSGEAGAKEAVRPLLERVGRKVIDLGEEPGAANVSKVAFNFLIASAIEAMSEAFAVVEASGLDPRAFHEMITATLFGCPLYEGYGRQILDRSYREPGFKLTLGLKDVGLAQQTASAAGARMPLADLLEKRFEAALEHGRGDMDWSAVAAEAREDAGLEA